MKGHWSDCAVHNAPALSIGSCDCGGLELALDTAHDLIPALVPVARSKGLLFCNESPSSLVQAQQLPADRLMTDAAASNLPHAHDGMVFFGDSDGVNLNVAGVSIVSKLEDVP